MAGREVVCEKRGWGCSAMAPLSLMVSAEPDLNRRHGRAKARRNEAIACCRLDGATYWISGWACWASAEAGVGVVPFSATSAAVDSSEV